MHLAVVISALVFGQHLALPSPSIALDCEEGRRLFEESKAKADFFLLLEQFVTQETQAFCGVASAVTVLNAASVPSPSVAAWAPYHAFTQTNIFTDAAKQVIAAEQVNRGGMTLDQLVDLLRTHPANATAVHAGKSSLDAFRAELKKNLASTDDFMIANFDRGELGMETMGHISPLAAYDEAADKVLILDVARYKYPPFWVDAAALFRAMSTSDPASGDTRGWVTLRRAETAPGPTGAKARNMLHMLIAIVSGAFALGLLLGGSVGFRVAKRRFKKIASP